MINHAEIEIRNPTPAAIIPFFAESTPAESPVIPEASCIFTAKNISINTEIAPAEAITN